MEIRKSFCNICGNCAMDVWVESGKILRVEGSRGDPQSGGTLCAKGYANFEYVYHPDRIRTPLRRTGPRGAGQFEPISWEEAYATIARRLLDVKKEYGAESVAFYSGHAKWYRPIYHRFVHAFGSLNYGTESSSCFQAGRMAQELCCGTLSRPDMMNSDLFIGWPENSFQKGVSANDPLDAFRERGGKVILIDPRVTPNAKLSDLHLRPRPGTDGALALCFGHHLIRTGAIDREYIEKYVHGFEEYARYARAFTLKKTAQITGIPQRDIRRAAEMIASAGRFCIAGTSIGILHHNNGMQTARAIFALSAITGNFDREGGMLPAGGSVAGECTDDRRSQPKVLWNDFIDERRPVNVRPKIGTQRFPLWSEVVDEYQSMDLARNIVEGTPYPIRAVFALGFNHRMFPGNGRLLEALEQVDFFVNTDIFMTDTAKYADIVLPACTSLERADLHQAGPLVRFLEPAILPLYESKSDADILCELAAYMALDDDILLRGYEYICKYVLRRVGVTLEGLRSAQGYVRIPGALPYIPGSNLRRGLLTPTGKFELYSERIAAYTHSHGLHPLPVYAGLQAGEEWPLVLVAGGRIPWQVHSRMHRIRAIRALENGPAADIHPQDAAARGIAPGDEIELVTQHGQIRVRAHVTHMVLRGTVHMYQDYPQADVNAILDLDALDPYSGFPAYRSVPCDVHVPFDRPA